MSDPLGFINGVGGAGGVGGVRPNFAPKAGPADAQSGASFKDVLMENLREVNKLQQEATAAVEDFQTGKRTDIEGVVLATQKADNAFRMLQSLRNKVMDAYEEVKQVRV